VYRVINPNKSNKQPTGVGFGSDEWVL